VVVVVVFRQEAHFSQVDFQVKHFYFCLYI
jgi:hypothetical protein